MIQGVNAAFFPKSVRVTQLNCYTVAVPRTLSPAHYSRRQSSFDIGIVHLGTKGGILNVSQSSC